MILEIIGVLFLILSFITMVSFFYIYINNYRFATIFHDLLPYYDYMILLQIVGVLIGTTFLYETFKEIVIISIFILGLSFYLLYLFRTWKNNYRLSYYESVMKYFDSNKDIEVITFDEWEDNPKRNPEKCLIIIRHDVHIYIKRAKEMAEIETKYNIPSTYFIRNNAERYDFEQGKDLIEFLVSLDFKIGFHYETIANTSGDLKSAVELFHKEVEQFREIYPLRFIASHGDGYRNGRLVSENLIDLSALDLVSAYQIEEDFYISEAGGNHHFIRDEVQVTFKENMKKLYPPPKGKLVQILVHPDWWFKEII